MLKAILSPLTTATSAGVTARYVISMISAVIAILGSLKYLSPEQVDVLTEQLPAFVSALFGLVALVIPIYAAFTKSSSDKAADAAKAIDKELPPSAPVVIQTPGTAPDIRIPAK